jgi:hypothetical protein
MNCRAAAVALMFSFFSLPAMAQGANTPQGLERMWEWQGVNAQSWVSGQERGGSPVHKAGGDDRPWPWKKNEWVFVSDEPTWRNEFVKK